MDDITYDGIPCDYVTVSWTAGNYVGHEPEAISCRHPENPRKWKYDACKRENCPATTPEGRKDLGRELIKELMEEE